MVFMSKWFHGDHEAYNNTVDGVIKLLIGQLKSGWDYHYYQFKKP